MKAILLFVTLFAIDIHHPDLQVYRRLLDQSLENKEAANQFYKQLSTVNEDSDPTLLGFKAMSEFMLCKHLFNPMSKLSHFNKGRALLEKAIQKNNLDPELLYFRLSTQSNVPSVLRYSGNINADKLALISYLKKEASDSQADQHVYKRIKAYLLINQYCTAEEKELIKNL